MAQPKGQSPKLLTLPVELLQAVAGNLGKEDVLCLRLASKDLSRGADRAFVDVFSSERAHIYSIFGLETLVGITAYPSLAKKIEKITLVVEQPASWVREPFDIKDIKQWMPEQEILEHAISTERYGRATEIWLEEARQLEGHVSGLLGKVFDNLHRAGQVVSVAITDRPPWLLSAYGAATLVRELGLTEDIKETEWEETVEPIEGADCRSATEALLSAITASPVLVKDLDLCGNSDGHGVGSLSLPAELATSATFTTACHTLKILRLGIDSGCSVQAAPVHCALTTLPRNATCLEELSLSIVHEKKDEDDTYEDFSDHNIFRQLADLIPAGHLRKLSLSMPLTATEQQLCLLISKHQNTLTDLHISAVKLPPSDDWAGVLTHAVNTASLQHVYLFSLYVGLEDAEPWERLELNDANNFTVWEWWGNEAVRKVCGSWLGAHTTGMGDGSVKMSEGRVKCEVVSRR